MIITWEDRKNIGQIDGIYFTTKPTLSFDCAWFLVTDDTAQYVPTHEDGVWNRDLDAAQKQEILAFYGAYVREATTLPTYDATTHKIEENGTEVINGLTYKHYDVVELTVEELATIAKSKVSQTLTPRQFRLQLLALVLLDEVEAMATTDKATQIWFEYSLDFQRSHPMIEAMAVQLGLTQDDMDTFFIEASKL